MARHHRQQLSVLYRYYVSLAKGRGGGGVCVCVYFCLYVCYLGTLATWLGKTWAISGHCTPDVASSSQCLSHVHLDTQTTER